MHRHRELIDLLTDCFVACEHCAASCLNEAEINTLITCIKIDLDCAGICNLAMTLLARNSARAAPVIRACADICAECAEECEKHEHGHCKECAKACRQCEEGCIAYLNR